MGEKKKKKKRDGFDLLGEALAGMAAGEKARGLARRLGCSEDLAARARAEALDRALEARDERVRSLLTADIDARAVARGLRAKMKKRGR